MSFFDFSDPSSNGPLLGLLSGLGQAAMPSRMPVPFASVLGKAAEGYMQGQQQNLAYQRGQQELAQGKLGVASGTLDLKNRLNMINMGRAHFGMAPLSIDDLASPNTNLSLPSGQTSQTQSAGASATPQGTQPLPSANAAAATSAPGASADLPYQYLAAGNTNEAMQLLLKERTPLPDAQVTKLGFRPGTVVTTDPLGNLKVEQQSDVKSDAAISQDQKLYAGEHGERLMTAQEKQQAGFRPDAVVYVNPVTGQARTEQQSQLKSPEALAQDTAHAVEKEKALMPTKAAEAGADAAARANALNVKYDPDTITFMASQVLAGDKSPLAQMGYGNTGAANRAALRNEITKQAQAKGITGQQLAGINAEFMGTQAGERALGTRTANIEMAANELQQMAPIALEASGKVNRTQFPTLNSIMLAGERGTGDPDVVRLGVATNSLVNIYARAINPNGVPTDSDKAHAREILSQAWAKGQYSAAVDQMQKEIAAARAAPGAVRQEFRGAITGQGTALPQAAPQQQGANAPQQVPKFTPQDIQNAAIKSGRTVDQVKQELRAKGIQVQ